MPNTVYDATIGNGAVVTLDLPITIQKFTLTSGTVTGSNDLTLNELFTWTGGTIGGSGVTNANGGVVFGNSDSPFSRRRTFPICPRVRVQR